jgi:hypothetical protein
MGEGRISVEKKSRKVLWRVGGWPRLLISLASKTQWVPHPRVFCEGGHGAAEGLLVLNSR